MKVVFTLKARSDLARIRRYIAQDNPRAARRMAALLLSACEGLAQFPERGRIGLRDGTRELTTIHPYVIVYRVRADIEIVNIWHGAQNWSTE
jgi:addiction module RelE/StbE family toxin